MLLIQWCQGQRSVELHIVFETSNKHTKLFFSAEKLGLVISRGPALCPCTLVIWLLRYILATRKNKHDIVIVVDVDDGGGDDAWEKRDVA